jgi:hypothetical protein
VEAMDYFGPLPDSAVTAVLHSQTGRCYIGINYDGDEFEDPELLFHLMCGGLDKVLALGKPEPSKTKEVR